MLDQPQGKALSQGCKCFQTGNRTILEAQPQKQAYHISSGNTALNFKIFQVRRGGFASVKSLRPFAHLLPKNNLKFWQINGNQRLKQKGDRSPGQRKSPRKPHFQPTEYAQDRRSGGNTDGSFHHLGVWELGFWNKPKEVYEAYKKQNPILSRTGKF